MAVNIIAYLDGQTKGCGYRFIVTQSYTSWRAYQTVAGLKYFLKNFGLEIDKNLTEIHDYRHLGKGRFISLTCKEKKRWMMTSTDSMTCLKFQKKQNHTSTFVTAHTYSAMSSIKGMKL